MKFHKVIIAGIALICSSFLCFILYNTTSAGDSREVLAEARSKTKGYENTQEFNRPMPDQQITSASEKLDSFSGLDEEFIKNLLGGNYQGYNDTSKNWPKGRVLYHAFHDRLFSLYDLNRDGFHNDKEQKEANAQMDFIYSEIELLVNAKLLPQFDKNGDGQITAEEERDNDYKITQAKMIFPLLKEALDKLEPNPENYPFLIQYDKE